MVGPYHINIVHYLHRCLECVGGRGGAAAMLDSGYTSNNLNALLFTCPPHIVYGLLINGFKIGTVICGLHTFSFSGS